MEKVATQSDCSASKLKLGKLGTKETERERENDLKQKQFSAPPGTY